MKEKAVFEPTFIGQVIHELRFTAQSDFNIDTNRAISSLRRYTGY